MSRRPIAGKALGVLALLLALSPAPPASALSCAHSPFQKPGEGFGADELVAHVEVQELRADRTMTVRILRVLHGKEVRPLVTVDAAHVFAWKMHQQWGFEPFTEGTQWAIVMLPGSDERAPWQPQLCRAFLKVDGGSAVGYVGDLRKRERLPLDALAERVAAPQPPAGPTTSR